MINRELKFRVYNKVLKAYAVEFAGANKTRISEFELPDLRFNGWDDDSYKTIKTRHLYNKDDFVIQGATGIYDSKGQEVWINDILAVRRQEIPKFFIGEVIWSQEYATYLVNYHFGQNSFSDYLCDIKNKELIFEIVGNTVANPEKTLNNN